MRQITALVPALEPLAFGVIWQRLTPLLFTDDEAAEMLLLGS